MTTQVNLNQNGYMHNWNTYMGPAKVDKELVFCDLYNFSYCKKKTGDTHSYLPKLPKTYF